jgi:hypothetical protein
MWQSKETSNATYILPENLKEDNLRSLGADRKFTLNKFYSVRK